MTTQQYADILADNGVPLIEGEIVKVRCDMRGDNWYAKIEGKGWFWFGTYPSRSAEWKPCPMGPPGETP